MSENFYILYPDAEVLQRERARIFSLLTTNISCGRILEVGSTAIEGVIGKGDVDILVCVECSDFETARDILDELFQRNPHQLSNNSFQGYIVDASIDMAIQLTVSGGAYDIFEVFMNALKRSPKLIEEYNQLKRVWHGKPMEEYRAAKSKFIEHVLQCEKRLLL